MQYLDASVLIAAYLLKDPHHKVCNRFMSDLSSGKKGGVVSIFGLAEVAGYFARNIDPEAAHGVVQFITAIPNISIASHFVEIPAMNLLGLCTDYGLSGADALHVIHAQSFLGVDELVTLDRDFLRVKDLLKVTILR